MTLFPRLPLFPANDTEPTLEGSVRENSHERELTGMFLKMESPAILLPLFKQRTRNRIFIQDTGETSELSSFGSTYATLELGIFPSLWQQ